MTAMSARVGPGIGAGVGGSSGASPLHTALRETSRIERRIDEERLAREKAISALEARLASEASRSTMVSSRGSSARGEEDFQRKETALSIRRLGDRLDLIESHSSRCGDPPISEPKLRLLESELRRALDLAEAQLAEGLERRLREVDAQEGLEARLGAKLGELEKAGVLQRAVADSAADAAAKASTDLNNLNVSLRREVARQSGVVQRTALEALDRQLGALRQDFARSESEQTDLHRNMRTSLEALKSDVLGRTLGAGGGRAPRQLSPLSQAQQELTPVACAGVWSARDEQSPSPSPTPSGEGPWTEAVRELECKLQGENSCTPDWNSQAGSQDDSSPVGFLELLTTLRQEMARLASEVHRSLSESEVSHNAALEELDSRLKEEIDCIIACRGDEVVKGPCGGAGGSNFQADLSALEADIRAALADHGQLAESQAADLEALDVRLSDEIQRVSTEHFEGQDSLRIAATSQRRELLEGCLLFEEKQGQANTTQRAALESLDAGNKAVRCLVLEFKDELQSASIQANSDFRKALTASESTLRGELEDRHGQWSISHKAALEAHAAQQAVLEHLDAKSQRTVDQESAEHHTVDETSEALRTLGLQLRDELEKKQGQADIDHKACLEALDTKFQTEIDRLAGQHLEGHNVVTVLVSECKAELHGATGQIHFNQCKAMEALESTLRSEFEEKRAQSDIGQKAALQALESDNKLLALEAKLQVEIDNVDAKVDESAGTFTALVTDCRDTSLADHRRAFDTLESKLRGEIEEKYSQANASRKTAFETLDEKLRTEIGRIAAGTQDGDEDVESLVSEYCGILEAKLREEIGKSDSTQQAAIHRLSAGHETLRDLLADSGTTFSAGELDAAQREALDAAEARLRVELLQAVAAAMPQSSPRGCLDAGC